MEIIIPVIVAISPVSNSGNNQLPVRTRDCFTSSKTSPGTAKIFNRRANRDISGSRGTAGAGADGIGGGVSMIDSERPQTGCWNADRLSSQRPIQNGTGFVKRHGGGINEKLPGVR